MMKMTLRWSPWKRSPWGGAYGRRSSSRVASRQLAILMVVTTPIAQTIIALKAPMTMEVVRAMVAMVAMI
jgi:hypothetical protein